MSKIKEAYSKLNPKVALVGTAVILTTSIGTCQLTKPALEEPTVEEAPLVVPVDEPAIETEEPAEEPAEEVIAE